MEVKYAKSNFTPISITLETKEEFILFTELFEVIAQVNVGKISSNNLCFEKGKIELINKVLQEIHRCVR